MQLHNPDTGRFITFEGGEGSGKSTQAGILANRLARAGRKVFATREPGGTPAAEEMREALLSGRVWQFGPFAEALMFAVARADHIEQAIGQALHEGKWVVCDRFLYSTRAYQGTTAGVPRGLINALERLTTGGLSPDVTFILDIPPEEGLARAAERRSGTVPDRFENQELMLHERVRRAFLDIAEEEPDRCIVVDASQPEAMVAEDVWEVGPPALEPVSMAAERARAAALAEPDRLEGFSAPREVDRLFGHDGCARRVRRRARQRPDASRMADRRARRRRQGDARLSLRPHGAGSRVVGAKASTASTQCFARSRRNRIRTSSSSVAPGTRSRKRYAQMIGVDEVRRLRAFLGTTAGEGSWRVVIVDRADELNQNAANALLKALEEPPPRTLFLLISSAEGRLPVTIRSRSRTLRVSALGRRT